MVLAPSGPLTSIVIVLPSMVMVCVVAPLISWTVMPASLSSSILLGFVDILHLHGQTGVVFFDLDTQVALCDANELQIVLVRARDLEDGLERLLVLVIVDERGAALRVLSP